jgi:hypothetical protein
MLRSHTVWLVPLALTLVGFKPNAALANAQTTYTFSANYNFLNSLRFITSDVSEIFLSGESTDAPYGLTKLNGLVYGETNFATGEFSGNTDPTTFGLQGVPFGSIVLEGGGSDKLFATESATGLVDFGNLTATNSGTLTITGGEGIFTGATGTLTFSEVGTLNPDPTGPYRGRLSVNGFFQTVPEPRTNTTIVVTGVIGVGMLLRRHRRKSIFG